jgi:hypothetical protein
MELMRSLQDEDTMADIGESDRGCLVAAQISRGVDEDGFWGLEGATKLQRGALVRLKGLQRAEMNGSIGKLLYFSCGRGRWDVDIADVGIKALKEENLEWVSNDTPHKPFTAWRSFADVGGNWQLAEVGVVLHLDQCQEITTLKQEGGAQHSALKCTFSAVGRARVHGICNPEAFTERASTLLAEVSRFPDEDVTLAQKQHEGRTVNLMKDILVLHRKTTPKKWLSVVAKKSILDSLGARPGKEFWGVVSVWECFLQARVRMQKLRNVIDESLEKMAAELPSDESHRLAAKINSMLKASETVKKSAQGEGVHAINITDLPLALLGKFQNLGAQMEPSVFDRRAIDRALPLQQLIQAETHRERLQIFEAALLREKAELEVSADGEGEGISLSEVLEQGGHEIRELPQLLSKL